MSAMCSSPSSSSSRGYDSAGCAALAGLDDIPALMFEMGMEREGNELVRPWVTADAACLHAGGCGYSERQQSQGGK